MEAPDIDHEEKIPGITNTALYDESKVRNTIMTNQKLEKSKTHQSRVSCKKISKNIKKSDEFIRRLVGIEPEHNPMSQISLHFNSWSKATVQ